MTDQITKGLRFYQSANADAATIKEDFIIRLEEFEIIMDDIRRNPMRGAVQHYLLVGRRGSGKSTLLKRLQVEIDQDEQLKQTHIAINPAEEQANIYRLYDLLLEIIDELEDKGIAITQPEYDEDSNAYSRSLFAAIHEAIEKEGKKIVLLLDNIDRIFENIGDDQGLVRELLLNFDDIKIIGGSTKMTEHFWQYDQPFYQFFRILELKQLTKEEIKRLLLMWGEKFNLPELKTFVTERTGQLETVRLLTDGLPRTLQFFINILISHTQETGYEYLERIMDYVTPLYQERLNKLPAPQRKIVLQMAFLWEAAGAGEIALATHMGNNLISAQLKQLIDKEIAEKIATDTKNNLYRLSERFFNLWLIFTQGNQKEKRKAKCLTVFLESFYGADGLKNFALAHLKLLEEHKMTPDKAAMITKALAQSKYISSATRDELIDNTLQLGEIADDLKKQLPLSIKNIITEIEELTQKQLYEKALNRARSIEQEDGIQEYLAGNIHFKQGNYELAEKYYLHSIKKEEKSRDKSNFQVREMPAKYGDYERKQPDKEKKQVIASFNLALLYHNAGKIELAEKYYLLAIENGGSGVFYNLGLLYHNEGNIELAEKYYLLAIDKGNIDALNNIGLLYDKQGEIEFAEKYYLLAVEKGLDIACFNMGVHYCNLKKYEQAEKYYLLAIEKGHTGAIYNLGLLYDDLKKNELAEKYYVLAINKGIVDASYNLGLLNAKLQRYELAEKYFLDAGNNRNTDALCNLGLLYAILEKNDLAEEYFLLAIDKGNISAIYNLGLLYQKLGKNKLAEKYYLLAIELANIEAKENLTLLYYEQAKNKTKALELINQLVTQKGDKEQIVSIWIVINVWNGHIPEVQNELKKLINNKKYDYLATTLENLLYHYQVNMVNHLFEDPEFGKDLIERFQPLYYAVRLLIGKDHNLELKIPPEIKGTVDEILVRVKEKQEFYYGANR